MVVTLERNQDFYLSDFEVLQAESGASEAGWLKDFRSRAIRHFESLGFPSRTDEAWRFTNLTPVTKVPFLLASEPGRMSPEKLETAPFTSLGGARLVFVDGWFSKELSSKQSLPEGVTFQNLAAALDSDPDTVKSLLGKLADDSQHAFAALNGAFFRDGALVRIRRGTVSKQPIHLLYITTGSEVARRIHPRNLVLIEENCEVCLVESYLGLEKDVYLSNPVTEIRLGDNSHLDHYRVQTDSPGAFHIGMNQVHQGRDSRYVSHFLDFGSSIARNDISCFLDGEGGWSSLNGLYLLKGTQHIDNYTTLVHAKPHCDSREVFKGILDERANGAFRGRIIVHKGAQKTDSKQTNQNLLLSDDAFVNTKPQLEIYADDVKCTHGATIGQLDANSMFYLRSRGISEEAARSILVYAFANELLEEVEIEELHEELVGFLTEWLPRGDIVSEIYGR